MFDLLAKLLIFISSLILIIIACELFTNSIEWAGYRYRISEGFAGSVLAAVGTALPETMIPIVAFVFGTTREMASEIGIGAILGAPFMLATLAMLVGGVCIVIRSRLGKKSIALTADREVLVHDLNFFILVYSVVILAAIAQVGLAKYFIAMLLITAYILYVHQLLRKGKAMEEPLLSPLYFSRISSKPNQLSKNSALIIAQLIFSLALLISGAKIFVWVVEQLSLSLGISAFLLSFFIAPVATELPEKGNSIIWYLRGKDTLAIGNITGAMVFQGSVLPALGILVTEWSLGAMEISSIALTLLSVSVIYVSLLKKRLNGYIMSSCGVFYVIYVLLVLTYF